MKQLLVGGLLGLLVVVFGVPLAPALDVLAAFVRPVTIAFVLGLAARPHLRRPRRWTA